MRIGKRRCVGGIALLVAVVAFRSPEAHGESSGYGIAVSSYLGGSGFDDAVVGAGIQSDGTIVLAANVGADFRQRIGLVGGRGAAARGRAANQGGAVVVRLSPDGRKLLSLRPIGGELKDMAIDGEDGIYLAAGARGVIRLSAKSDRVVWAKPVGDCSRVDAAADGHVAAVAAGSIHVFDPRGRQIGRAHEPHYPNDVCVDGVSKTVVYCGFRNARAFDGKKTYPVQICYVRGLSYRGERKWTGYDWSTDRDSDRFLNKPTNNMADTRADRCSIGRDGKLYVTFQVAGGNHIFRYSPTDITQKVKLVGGDKYHQFYNSRSEHKCFFARYEPGTGAFLAGQEFCGRLSNGRANSVVTKTGDIGADEAGRVYLVGKAAFGLPLSANPDGGEYTGGGFVLVMSPDLRTRLLCTRTCAGKGAPHAVDARTIGRRTRAVFAGSGMPEGMFVRAALQPKAADPGKEKEDPKDGFFVVIAPN
ncbi:MAG: hypothetical protein ACYSU0_14940 [Planctomycetota bacterium]